MSLPRLTWPAVVAILGATCGAVVAATHGSSEVAVILSGAVATALTFSGTRKDDTNGPPTR